MTLEGEIGPLPPLPYRAVYRLNLETPRETLYVVREADREVVLHPGPIRFSYSVPAVKYSPPYAETWMDKRRVEQPAGGSYLVVQTRIDPARPQTEIVKAALQCAEYVGLFDLRYPQIVSEKVFQGVANTAVASALIQEGPLPMAASQERDPKDVADQISSDAATLDNLSVNERERYRLAARWFRRGHEAVNPVDKLLFWWVVLEIYPGEGERDVVGRTRDLLCERLYPDLTPRKVKSRTQIGRICGLRGDIVHQGRAFVATDEQEEFDEHLDRLHAVAVTCLRILAGLAVGDELDKYVRE